MQLAYTRDNPHSRFKMPSKWYTKEFPEEDPLVRIIFFDGNYKEGNLTAMEKLEQKRFLESELARETKASWTWLVNHFPMFTQTTNRRDRRLYITMWGELLKKHNVSLYLSGHDHNLQHLKAEGHETHFVISGAGGARLHGVTPARGYGDSVFGFNHFYVTRDFFEMQILDADGNRLYHFREEAKEAVD